MRRYMAFAAACAALIAGGVSEGRANKADDTLNWATATEIDTFDIYYQGLREVVIATLYNCDSLMYRDPASNEYKPLLAEAYRWVDDTTLELDLRQGIKFTDGTDLDAEDVAYTFNHVIKPDSGINVRLTVDWIDSVEAVNPHQVRIKAKAPTPAALEYLSGNTPIYPSGHYDNAPVVSVAGDKTRQDWGAVLPVCAGPYKLTQFEPGRTATWEKNPDYFADSPKGQPQLGKIVYRTISDTEAQLAELLTGSVDWIWGVPPENVEQLSTYENVTVEAASTTRMAFLMLDAAGRSGDTPAKDVRIRQAIAHAIDRDALADLVGNSAGVLRSMCYADQVGCTEDVTQYDYDPEKAKALLAEAGYKDGLDLPFYAYRDRRYSEAVLAYLRAVGIRPDFQFIQNVALRPLIIDGKVPMAHLTWGSQGMMDASASVSLYFKFGVDDYARDAELRDMLVAADTAMDPEKRKELYAQALARIADQAYSVPLFTYGRAYAYSSDLGYQVTSDEIAHFYLAKWK
ncbi:ABC transporter substrate-binding protein [Nitratireductor soli]|uniref:ABC transporter substrate-binding protein n=1 Tax=Nitratireductor soli TaxID=1670619 RepID=UPI000AE2C84E|nr:ABC transporter substrate-binding protein [Nitratireductor soli]